MEALHAIQSISGDCANLISGVEFAMAEYCVQTQARQNQGIFSMLGTQSNR